MLDFNDILFINLFIKFFQIESKNLLHEMLLQSIAVDFYNYVFVLTVTFLFTAYV